MSAAYAIERKNKKYTIVVHVVHLDLTAISHHRLRLRKGAAHEEAELWIEFGARLDARPDPGGALVCGRSERRGTDGKTWPRLQQPRWRRVDVVGRCVEPAEGVQVQ